LPRSITALPLTMVVRARTSSKVWNRTSDTLADVPSGVSARCRSHHGSACATECEAICIEAKGDVFQLLLLLRSMHLSRTF
jgi:hypothetical protein